MAQKPYDFRQRSFLFASDIVAFARVVADRGYLLGRLAAQLVKSGASVRMGAGCLILLLIILVLWQ